MSLAVKRKASLPPLFLLSRYLIACLISLVKNPSFLGLEETETCILYSLLFYLHR